MIITAVQRGSSITVYGVGNKVLLNLAVGTNGPKDGLVGYTATTVSIRRNSMIVTYDVKGRIISNVSAR